MATKPDSAERARSLLREARKEAETLKSARARPAGAARPAPPAAARATAAQTPLDQPTVVGWAHPAARDAEPKVKIAAEEKWARLAAIMATEQREAREKRAKLRRGARQALIGITALIVLVVMFSLRR
ncbi:MAG: hypothetical protein IT515_14530 [Burkholderiales bacterium]|nr:hypothetical protein [Burkholderiales bacterium]